MATYTVFESTNMGSTHYAERIFDAVSDVDIENGTFGYLDGLATDESVIYNFKAGTKDGERVVVADQPAWEYDTCLKSNQRKDKFIIKAGTPFRVRVVKELDEFAITEEGFTPATKSDADVDTYLTIDATGKLAVSTSSTTGAVMEAQIMRKRTYGGTISTAAHNYGYSRVMYEAKVITLA